MRDLGGTFTHVLLAGGSGQALRAAGLAGRGCGNQYTVKADMSS